MRVADQFFESAGRLGAAQIVAVDDEGGRAVDADGVGGVRISVDRSIVAAVSERLAKAIEIETLREALKGSDMEPVKAGMSSLAESLQRVSTAAYQAAASSAGDSGNGTSDGTGDDADRSGRGAGAEGAEDAEGAAEEETVEGEFKEV